MQHHSVSG